MKRQIEVEVGGEIFRMVPSFQAMALLEDRVNQSLLELSNEVVRKTPRLSLLCRIMYAGILAGGDTKWTEAELGEFMMEHHFYRESKVHRAVIDFLHELLQAGSSNDEQKKSWEMSASPNISSSSPPSDTKSVP